MRRLELVKVDRCSVDQLFGWVSVVVFWGRRSPVTVVEYYWIELLLGSAMEEEGRKISELISSLNQM